MTVEVWPFCPQTGIVESLEWQTDIIECRSTESRQALRLVPRQGFTYKHHLSPAMLGRAVRFARSYPLAQFYLPIWTEFARLDGIEEGATSLAVSTTLTSYSQGRRVLVWGDELTYEVCEITSVVADSLELASPLSRAFATACVMPLELAEFEQLPSVQRTAGAVSVVEARFRLISAVDLSDRTYPAFASHDGYEVVTDPSELSGGLTEELDLAVETLDSETGLVYRAPQQSSPKRKSSLSWTKHNRADAWNLRLWLYSLAGACGSFWIPTWNRDFALAANVATNATALSIQDIGYRTAYPGISHVAFRLTDGSFRFAKATSCTAGESGVETLALSTSFGASLAMSSVNRAGWLTRMRFLSDRLELKHGNAGSVVMSADVVEVA